MNHMADKIKRLFRIWQLNLKNRLMERMVFKFNFALMTVGVFLQMLLSLAFIKIIFAFISNIAGWTYEQALVVVASYMLIEGLLWGTCAYLAGISEHVRTGTLDNLLVKPIDAQFMVSVWRGDPEDWARVVTAFAVFFIALNGLNLTPAALLINTFFYFWLIANAYLIVYSLTLFVRCASFWTTDDSSLWRIMDNITRMSQYPTDIFFHKTVRFFFSAVIPLAFMATIPAKILIHGPDWRLILASTLVAAIFFVGSRKFWHFALKNYSSASS